MSPIYVAESTQIAQATVTYVLDSTHGYDLMWQHMCI